MQKNEVTLPKVIQLLGVQHKNNMLLLAKLKRQKNHHILTYNKVDMMIFCINSIVDI